MVLTMFPRSKFVNIYLGYVQTRLNKQGLPKFSLLQYEKDFFETDKIVLQNSSVFGTYNDKSWAI